MLSRPVHTAGVTVVVGATTFSAAYGGDLQVGLAYALSVLLGVTIYLQDTSRSAAEPWGTLMLGALLGAFANLSIGVAVTRWHLAVPLDVLVWQLGVFTWDSWLGVVGVTLIAAFLAGMVGAID